MFNYCISFIDIENSNFVSLWRIIFALFCEHLEKSRQTSERTYFYSMPFRGRKFRLLVNNIFSHVDISHINVTQIYCCTIYYYQGAGFNKNQIISSWNLSLCLELRSFMQLHMKIMHNCQL